ncbi:MAG: YraN family protein [candidate division WOR-3 bacterium]
MSDKIGLGRKGEELAIAYLKSKGFKILAKNRRNRFGEIDIIAKDHGVLVFVEVKTRTTTSFGSPIQAIDATKQNRLRNLALRYIAEEGLADQQVRFDVLCVLQTPETTKIEHIPNAF